MEPFGVLGGCLGEASGVTPWGGVSRTWGVLGAGSWVGASGLWVLPRRASVDNFTDVWGTKQVKWGTKLILSRES